MEVQTDRCEAPPSGSGDTERIRLLEAQVKHLQGKVQSLKQARSVRVMDDDKVHFYTGTKYVQTPYCLSCMLKG